MPYTNSNSWKKSNLQVFWSEIAPSDHVVQVYERDSVLLNALEGFVGSGFLAGDNVVIIVTDGHKKALEERLTDQGFDLELLTATNQYTVLSATETLDKFMINKWPDEVLFMHVISEILHKVQQNGNKVRAFGEMVAILWQNGNHAATVQLENLWNKLHSRENFSLFCAYPKEGFTDSGHSSINIICSTHTQVIDGNPNSSTEIKYKTPAVLK